MALQVIGAEPGAPQPDPETGLYRYEGCIYIETAWNDGDSFQVQLPTSQTITARLYRVDSIETSIHDTTAARRLRAQRRYFGISDFGETPRDSIEKAIELGEAATEFSREALSQPFTLWTSYADARGSGDRIYVFIETAEGDALGHLLVKAGLARAFGVYRQTPRGIPQSESIERMQDLELSAAAGRRGVWAYTDWEALPEERLAERRELEELRLAMRTGPEVTASNPINLNDADANTLQRLPGIGPALAARIIEHRGRQPFRNATDLKKVSGIGSKTYTTLEPLVAISEKEEADD
jgi:competence ComEA-like helix-hairpin-helix protein